MKRYYMSLLVGLALTSSLMPSCSSADKLSDLGEASQRTREVLREYTDRLEGNKGYWLLTYWPDSRLRYGGYNFFVHFEGGKVTGLTELHPTAVTSLYDVTTIDQPTLSFSTFNDALLHFSKSSEYFRSARGGDFELLLKEIKGDTILLEGRKQGTRMTLVPFASDPATEITAIQRVSNLLRTAGLTSVTIGTAGTVALRLHPGYRQIEFTPEGGTTVRAPFVYTSRGLRFYQPVTLGGVTLSELVLSSDDTQLQSPDGSIQTTIVNPPLDFATKTFVYYAETGFVSPKMLQHLTRAKNALTRTGRGTLQTTGYWGAFTAADLGVNLRGNDSHNTMVMTSGILTTQGYYNRASYEVDFVGVGADPTQLDILLRDGNDSSGWYFYSSIMPIVEGPSSKAPYTITAYTDDGGATYYYYLQSTTDADYWLYLYPYSA